MQNMIAAVLVTLQPYLILFLFSALKPYSSCMEFDPYWAGYIQIPIHLLNWTLSVQMKSFHALLRAGQGRTQS